jgi:hypothetical protein
VILAASLSAANGQETDEQSHSNLWRTIPFLTSSATPDELNGRLNNTSLPPDQRFAALAALLVSFVPTGEPSLILTNMLCRDTRWIDNAQIVSAPSIMLSPNLTITFTNDIQEWHAILPSDTQRWQRAQIVKFVKPSVWLWLKRSPRTTEEAVAYLKGSLPTEVEKFTILTWFDNSWVVFDRTSKTDRLRVYRSATSDTKTIHLDREPVVRTVEPPPVGAETKSAQP